MIWFLHDVEVKNLLIIIFLIIGNKMTLVWQVTGNRAEGKKRRSLDCQHASSLIIAIAIAIDISPIAIAIAIDIAIFIAVTFSS